MIGKNIGRPILEARAMGKDLMGRFKDEIQKANFNLFELKGFQEKPELAILAGMAIGYRMGIDFTENLYKQSEPPR